MVKTVLGVNHKGFTDWLIQRISAIIMAVYSISLIAFFFSHPNLGFDDWKNLFSLTSVKIATLVMFSTLLYHAWVGMWTVFTDYVTCYVARLILHTLVILSLIVFFFDALMVLWGNQ